MPLGLSRADKHLGLAAASEEVNDAGVRVVVGAKLVPKHANLLAMFRLGYAGYFDDSLVQFVEIPLFGNRPVKIIKAHPPPVVLRADMYFGARRFAKRLQHGMTPD